ncbi:MAG: DUF2182 domain-containing protein [Pseudoruegeria sp.]
MPWLLLISGCGLFLHLVHPAGAEIAAICGRIDLAFLTDLAAWRSIIWEPSALVWDWVFMLLMMMAPLVSQQVWHVWRANFPKKRAASLGLFGLAYLQMWLLAGLAIIPMGILVSPLFQPGVGTLVTLSIALVWSACPLAQAARNRCHFERRISVSGRRWGTDNFAQGIETGTYCVMACWPWMIVPLTVQQWHTPVMLVVAVFLLAERLAPSAEVRWRIPPGLVSLGVMGSPIRTMPLQ